MASAGFNVSGLLCLAGPEPKPEYDARLTTGVPIVRFETADTTRATAIGEGLTRPARAGERLLVDTDVGKYAVRHDDGCGVCGESITAGDAFYLDSDAGDVLCERHGRDRRGE